MAKITIIHKKDDTYCTAPADTQRVKDLYNQLLKRINNAETYFDDDTVPEWEKEIFIPEFEKLLKQISGLMNLMDILKIPFREEIA